VKVTDAGGGGRCRDVVGHTVEADGCWKPSKVLETS